MRKNIFMLMSIAAVLTACERNTDDIIADRGSKSVTFAVQGDFNSPAFEYGGATRAALTADNKAMTDLWVLDYQNGSLVQQLHQVSTDEDFGEPTIDLAIGDHHVYFVASRGEGVTLSTADHKLTWTKPLDTFYKDYTISVSSGTSSTLTVALDRVMTKLSITFLDEIPADIASITVTPSKWYLGFDYVSGLPTYMVADDPHVFNIPASYVGTSGRLSTNTYGFSSSTEWTANISIIARDADDDIIGQAEITSAPFLSNRVTAYSGNLFVNAGGFSISLNSDWSADYTATW